MVAAGLAPSNGAAARVITQGGVKVDGVRVTDRFHTVTAGQAPFILQVGRRARRILSAEPAVEPKNPAAP